MLGEMGSLGFESKSSHHTEGGLYSSIPVQTSLNKVTDCNKQLPQSNQAVLPCGGTASADKQKCSRTGGKPKLTGVLQPAIFGTQTQQPVGTDSGLEHLEHLFEHRVVQDGDPRDNKNLPTVRGVGHIHRFQRRILPHTNSQSVQEVHAFSPSGSVLPVQSPSLWPVHSPHGVHSGHQRGQTHGTSKGYKDPPVPRRLAGESLYPRHLSPAYSNPDHTVPGSRVAGEQGKIRTGPTTGLQLRRLPVRPESGQGQTNRGTLADLDRQDQINTVGSGMPGPEIYAPHRATHSNRKTSPLRARHIPGRLNVIADKLSRLGQTIQTEWSLHPAVFQAVCSRWHQPQVDLFATRFNNKLPQFVSLVPDPQAWAVDALSLSWEDLDPYAFPPAAILGKVVEKLQDYPCNRIILIAPGWPNMPWFLGPGGNVKPDPTVSALHTKPSVSALQPGPSQEPVESDPTCLAPRASAIKEQGFSEAVAARIEAPQRRSTRSVYEAKWTIFTKWCLSNQVDFRAPPLKAIADFLLHLFQDKKLQPGTIDCYRSAIADKLGNSAINVSKDENLTRLLDSFHRDRPKGRRGIPSWNLSLVLHQLTKAPFEPLKEASLKHLTFKTVFLLALGSGKRRSEIHAWLHKNIRHQSDWS